MNGDVTSDWNVTYNSSGASWDSRYTVLPSGEATHNMVWYNASEAHLPYVPAAPSGPIGAEHNPFGDNQPTSTELADKIRRTYMARATLSRLHGALTHNLYLIFDDDGHVRYSTADYRRDAYYRLAKKAEELYNKKNIGNEINIEDGQVWTISTKGWQKTYGPIIPRDKMPLTIKEIQKNPPPDFRQASFWLGSGEDLQVNGSFTIQFLQDQSKPNFKSFDIRNTNTKWRWVDRIDANSFQEYDWKNNSAIQGVLEGAAGDLVGDKLLGASFNIRVYFTDTDDRNLEYNVNNESVRNRSPSTVIKK